MAPSIGIRRWVGSWPCTQRLHVHRSSKCSCPARLTRKVSISPRCAPLATCPTPLPTSRWTTPCATGTCRSDSGAHQASRTLFTASASSTSWLLPQARIRSNSGLRMLKDGDKNRRVLEVVAKAAAWGTALSAGVHRGIAVADGFGSYAAAVAEVSVNDSGEPKIHRIVVAIDSGYVVNPDTLPRASREQCRVRFRQHPLPRDSREGWARRGIQLPRLPDSANRRDAESGDRARAQRWLLGWTWRASDSSSDTRRV